ncbi:MAG: adenosine deaminase [Spirochaetales bacterium]|nr:adenosine deaminase [Spirochaetales bacterium]
MKSFPAIDLHLHLDGAVQTATILELAREAGYALPAGTVPELDRFVRVSADCHTLTDFLKTFEIFYPLLKTTNALERISRELVEDLENQGLIYAEVRFAPILNVADPADTAQLRAAVEAVLYGLSSAQQLRTGLILCCYRGFPPDLAEKTIRLALDLNEERPGSICGIDLAGDESRYDASLYAAAFGNLGGKLPVTIHAAEAAPADSARKAIELLGARRIGHGVRIQEDPDLVKVVREKGIALEICLTSNLQTGTVSSLEEHPFAKYLAAGLCVTLNTDDPAISGITLASEWELARRTYGLSLADVQQIARNAARAAFVNEADRTVLEAQLLSNL